jgi:hypothetical protein
MGNFHFILEKFICKDWTKEEKQAVHNYLEYYIRRGVVPGKSECERCKAEAEGALNSREWRPIKYYVKNQINKRVKTTKAK